MTEYINLFNKLKVGDKAEEYEDDPIYEINMRYDDAFDYFDMIINRDGTIVFFDVAYELAKPLLITEYFETIKRP